MYGPVRTVVWQGSAGNRCPYADQTAFEEGTGGSPATLLNPIGKEKHAVRTRPRTLPKPLMDTYLGHAQLECCLRRGNRGRLQVRAEGEQTAVAILHYKLAGVPWRIGKSAREFHASGCVLGVKRVRIFDK